LAWAFISCAIWVARAFLVISLLLIVKVRQPNRPYKMQLLGRLQRIGVVDNKLDQYLTNELLRGEVDEVLWLKDGSMAPLDYKFAQYKDRIFDTYRTQLYCYAWLIEANYDRQVNRGFLVYTRSKNRLIEIEINANHVEKVQQASSEIQEILAANKYPKATKYKRRCVNCTYRNVCTK
jgi:CRISPR-associated exonuclease Cas4